MINDGIEIKRIIEKIKEDKELQFEILENCINSNDPKLIVPIMEKYLDSICITNSKIAEIAKKTPQATRSMIKSNEGDFPEAFNIQGTNYYIKKDVIEWLINNNKIPRNEDDDLKAEFLYGNEQIIYFTGGPGNGKSTICASGADFSIVPHVKKILTAGGDADTENLIKLHFKKNSVNYVIFHYNDSCNDSIPIRIIDENIDRIQEQLGEFKKEAKRYRENDEKEKLMHTYVEFVLSPNEILLDLMNQCNIDILTFIDTPGIDDNHQGDSIAMADIIVVVLGDRNDIKNIAEKIKTNIVPATGATKYIYLYNNRFALTESDNAEEVYNEFLEEAKVDLQDYVEALKILQDELVIGNTLSVCRPIESLICVPNFSRKAGAIERFFFTIFCNKIKESIDNSSYLIELNNFESQASANSFFKLLNKEMEAFFKKLNDNSLYGFSEFISEGHGRTKSLDNYRIEYNFEEAITELKKYFYESFSKYKTEKADEYEASVIRMVYLTINEALMNKVHYGYGSHPWEDVNSPTQMICEEVLSEKIIENDKNLSYCEILKENSIKSNSWNYVYICNTDWNKAKLEVSNNYKLPSYRVKDLVEYIEVCHFVPAILIQSILCINKMDTLDWKSADYSRYFELMDKIMNDSNV